MLPSTTARRLSAPMCLAAALVVFGALFATRQAAAQDYCDDVCGRSSGETSEVNLGNNEPSPPLSEEPQAPAEETVDGTCVSAYCACDMQMHDCNFDCQALCSANVPAPSQEDQDNIPSWTDQQQQQAEQDYQPTQEPATNEEEPQGTAPAENTSAQTSEAVENPELETTQAVGFAPQNQTGQQEAEQPEQPAPQTEVPTGDPCAGPHSITQCLDRDVAPPPLPNSTQAQNAQANGQVMQENSDAGSEQAAPKDNMTPALKDYTADEYKRVGWEKAKDYLSEKFPSAGGTISAIDRVKNAGGLLKDYVSNKLLPSFNNNFQTAAKCLGSASDSESCEASQEQQQEIGKEAQETQREAWNQAAEDSGVSTPSEAAGEAQDAASESAWHKFTHLFSKSSEDSGE